MMRWLKRILLLAALALVILALYEKVLFRAVKPKQRAELFRIGYINLHANRITEKDLLAMSSFGCDMWLFIEWNGNNLDGPGSFKERYRFVYQEPDATFFGMAVLAADSAFSVTEIGKDDRPYQCDFPKHRIAFRDSSQPVIYFIHAPPVHPKCGVQTEKYISDLVKELKKERKRDVILAGDFNSLSWQQGMKTIRSLDFTDSYTSVNSWPALTFGPVTWLPKMIRVDYIFHKGDVRPVQVQLFRLSSSDHAGYVADFAMPGLAKDH